MNSAVIYNRENIPLGKRLILLLKGEWEQNFLDGKFWGLDNGIKSWSNLDWTANFIKNIILHDCRNGGKDIIHIVFEYCQDLD